jgi:chromosome segregation ATPase
LESEVRTLNRQLAQTQEAEREAAKKLAAVENAHQAVEDRLVEAERQLSAGDAGTAEKLQSALAEVRAAENRLEEVSLALRSSKQENSRLQEQLETALAARRRSAPGSPTSDTRPLLLGSRLEAAEQPGSLGAGRQPEPEQGLRRGLSLEHRGSWAEAEVQKHRNAAAEHASEVERLTRKLVQQQEEHNERFTNWTIEKDELNVLIGSLQSEVKALTADLESLRSAQNMSRDATNAESAQLKADLAAAQEARSRLQRKVSALETELGRSKAAPAGTTGRDAGGRAADSKGQVREKVAAIELHHPADRPTESASVGEVEIAQAKAAAETAQERVQQLEKELEASRALAKAAQEELTATKSCLEEELSSPRAAGAAAVAAAAGAQPQLQKQRSRGIFGRWSKPDQQPAAAAARPGSAPALGSAHVAAGAAQATEALETLRAKHAALQERSSAAQEAHTSEKGRLLRELDAANAKAAELQAELERLQGSEPPRARELREAVKKLQSEKVYLERKLDDLNVDLERFNEEAKRTSEQHLAAKKGLEAERDQLASSLEASQGQIRNLEQTVQELQAAGDALKAQLAQHQEATRKLEANKEELLEQHAQLQRGFDADKAATLAQHAQRTHALETKLKALTQQADSLAADKAQLLERVSKLTADNSKMEEKVGIAHKQQH